MKEIREWLEKDGPDYAQGVALYAAHGKSRVVLAALQRGASDFTRQKLLSELRKLAIAGADVTTNVPAVVTAKPVHAVDTLPKRVDKTAIRVQKPDESIEPEVRRQRSAWFAERNHLHPQLQLVATNAERLALSLRILELGDLLSASYAGEPGHLATEPGHLATALGHLANLPEGEARRLLANLRPQRTKLKKRPDRAPELARVVASIQLLEERLQRDGGEPELHQRH